MTLALTLLTLIILVTGTAALRDRAEAPGFWVAVGAVLVAVVLVTWGLIVHVWVPYQSNTCRDLARGYALDPTETNWSFRHDCRVTLPGGQFVKEDRIRITTDGQIIVSDDGDD